MSLSVSRAAVRGHESGPSRGRLRGLVSGRDLARGVRIRRVVVAPWTSGARRAGRMIGIGARVELRAKAGGASRASVRRRELGCRPRAGCERENFSSAPGRLEIFRAGDDRSLPELAPEDQFLGLASEFSSAIVTTLPPNTGASASHRASARSDSDEEPLWQDARRGLKRLGRDHPVSGVMWFQLDDRGLSPTDGRLPFGAPSEVDLGG
ncbi:hypothetical protein CYMTET_54512 [Cymbomonas tetramitiformis]|uniref:Uncharacterized protein n=1 Tax=Cymbomonas tetramitiformis TaxID=36881 RepID=A0AAE0BG18_9CHLO|nr:hypothetical protein CYMTET_54512 [Cymbomonas tetramitiformis]